jgi:DNA invertase Pin-like site-specific DNA recombinase
MSKKPRVFRREMKVATVKRILAGEDISALARELKIRRTILYRWKQNTGTVYVFTSLVTESGPACNAHL